MSLSTVVQRTNIPLSKLPTSEAGSIRSTIGPEASLRQALRIISQFRQDYKCAAVQADIVQWVANKPKPKPKPPAKHHSKAKSTKSKTTKSKTPAKHPTTKHTAPAKHPTPTPTRTSGTTKSPGTTTHTGTTKHTDTSGTPTKTATSKSSNHRRGKTAAHKKTNPTNRQKTGGPHSVKHVNYPPEPVMPAFCPAFTGASG